MADFDAFAADLATAADTNRVYVFIEGKGKLYALTKYDLLLLNSEAMVVNAPGGLRVRVSPAGAPVVSNGRPLMLADGSDVRVTGTLVGLLDGTLYHWATLLVPARGFVAREMLTAK